MTQLQVQRQGSGLPAASAAVLVGTGLLGHPGNSQLRARVADGTLTAEAVRQLALRATHLLTVALAAADRGLLPDPVVTVLAELRGCDDRCSGHAGAWRGITRGAADLGRLFAPGRSGPQPAGTELVGTELDGEVLCQLVGLLAPPGWRADTIGAVELGRVHEACLALTPRIETDPPALRLVAEPGHRRRSTGAYYTPPELVERLLDLTLEPLLDQLRDHPAQLAGLRVCDPACGSGSFLVAAAQRIAGRLPAASPAEALRQAARANVHGVDSDELAAQLAQASLWLAAGRPGDTLADFAGNIRVGDSLLDPQVLQAGAPGGYDAVVGNPPWIAHAGRAAQPLDPSTRAAYARDFGAFAGYRTTHALFLEQAVRHTRPGGRVGLILPTSLADLDGYGPARAAATAAGGQVVTPVTHFGDGAFAGVFAPSMALVLSRGRAGPPDPGRWRLARPDLDDRARRILDRLADHPTFPTLAFADPGCRTDATNRSRLVAIGTSTEPAMPVREGRDITAFRANPARLELPSALLRPDHPSTRWEILVRQTARFPIAAANDATAFRNSLLGGHAVAGLDVPGTLALLNSHVIRWLHFQLFRDAREGMPQVKLCHLRALPLPQLDPGSAAELAASGAVLVADPSDAAAAAVAAELVAAGLGLTAGELAMIRAWQQPR